MLEADTESKSSSPHVEEATVVMREALSAISLKQKLEGFKNSAFNRGKRVGEGVEIVVPTVGVKFRVFALPAG